MRFVWIRPPKDHSDVGSGVPTWSPTLRNAAASHVSMCLRANTLQMDVVRGVSFPSTMATALEAGGAEGVEAEDVGYANLGYYVAFDELQDLETESDGLGNDFVDVIGPDQYWPDFVWYIIGFWVLGLIVTAAYCLRNKLRRHAPPEPTGGPVGAGMKGGIIGAGGKKGKLDDDPWSAEFNPKELEKGAYGEGGDGTGAFNETATAVRGAHRLVVVAVVESLVGQI